MTRLGVSPLNYPTGSVRGARRFRFPRAPTTSNYKDFKLTDEWLDTSSSDMYVMVEKTATAGLWVKIGGTSAAAETFTGDGGDVVGPDASNNVNIIGTTAQGITSSGTSATNTLAFTNADATTSQKGVMETATDAESTAGTSITVANTPASLAAKLGTQTDNAVLVGSGTTAAITALAVGTTGQLLIGTGADPAFGISADSDFTFTGSVAAASRTFLVTQTDNSNTASHAIVDIVSGGVNGGDPFVHLDVTGAAEKSFGMDNSDSDILKITTGATPSAGTTHWAMTVDGERTMPLQPAFLALNANQVNGVTGAGTLATVQFDTVIFDQNADYNNGTDTFTAPVTGRYLFIAQVECLALTAAMTVGSTRINTSNRFYQRLMGIGALRDNNNTYRISITALCDMDAADTANIQVQVSNGAGDNVNIGANAIQGITYFNGLLQV